MKLLTLILLGAIILHQTYLPVLNSILLLELGLLALFYFVGGAWIKEYRRKKETRSYLRGVTKRYMSKTEDKMWRSRSTTEVQVTKEDFFDRI